MNMADRRRRKKPTTSESEQSEVEDRIIRLPKERGPHRDSECESEIDYESVSEDVEEDDYTYTEDYSDEGDSVLIETDGCYEEDSEIFGERQSGDGEEQPENQTEVDDDEDRKNPAFVPKKGSFYEHDSRNDETDEAKEVKKKEIKKKLWLDSNRWDHDRFDLSKQGPKSREELVDSYGYDIRAHSKPPDSVPFLNNRGRGRRRSDRSQLADYITQERFPEQRRGVGSRDRGDWQRRGGEPRDRGSWQGRGGEFRRGGRGSRSRGGGRRGVPRQPGSHAPPGPPPERWVKAEERAYSDMRDRRRDRRYEEAESGSESFARDSSPNDPERYRPIRNRQTRNDADTASDGDRQRQDLLEHDYDEAEERRIQPGSRGQRRGAEQRGGYRRPTVTDDGDQPEDARKPASSQDARFDQGYHARGGQQRQPQGHRDTGRLENIMDIAPPLTTIETRTKPTVAMAAPAGQRSNQTNRRANNRQQNRPTRVEDSRDNVRDVRESTDQAARFREPEHVAVPQDVREIKQQTKRYSSQRQRNTDPDTATPPPPAAGMMNVPAGAMPGGPRPMLVRHHLPGGSSPTHHQPAPNMPQQGYYRPSTNTQGMYRPQQAAAAMYQPHAVMSGNVTSTRPVLGPQQQQQQQQHMMMTQQQALALQQQQQQQAGTQDPMALTSVHAPVVPAAAAAMMRPQVPMTSQQHQSMIGPQQQQYISPPPPAALVRIPAAVAQYRLANQMASAAATPPVAYQPGVAATPEVVQLAVNQGTAVSPQGQFIAAAAQGHSATATQAQPMTSQAPVVAQAVAAAGTAGASAELTSTSGVPGPGQPPAIHVRGGTTYFHPHIQQPLPGSDGRSPVRRMKEPIPIVQPQPGQAAYTYMDEQYVSAGLQYVEGQEFYPEEPLIASDVSDAALLTTTDDSVEYSMEYSDMVAPPAASSVPASVPASVPLHAAQPERVIYDASWKVSDVAVSSETETVDSNSLTSDAVVSTPGVSDVNASSTSPESFQPVNESTPKKELEQRGDDAEARYRQNDDDAESDSEQFYEAQTEAVDDDSTENVSDLARDPEQKAVCNPQRHDIVTENIDESAPLVDVSALGTELQKLSIKQEPLDVECQGHETEPFDVDCQGHETDREPRTSDLELTNEDLEQQAEIIDKEFVVQAAVRLEAGQVKVIDVSKLRAEAEQYEDFDADDINKLQPEAKLDAESINLIDSSKTQPVVKLEAGPDEVIDSSKTQAVAKRETGPEKVIDSSKMQDAIKQEAESMDVVESGNIKAEEQIEAEQVKVIDSDKVPSQISDDTTERTDTGDAVDTVASQPENTGTEV